MSGKGIVLGGGGGRPNLNSENGHRVRLMFLAKLID